MSLFRDYGIALALVAAALVIKVYVEPLATDIPAPFVFSSGVIILSAWFGGFRGGVAATSFSALGINALFLARSTRLAVPSAGNLTNLALFAVEGVAISWFTARVHRVSNERAGLLRSEHHARNQVRAHAEKLRRIAGDLRDSEVRFRQMADSAPVMIWVAEPDRMCSYFNRSWLDFTGKTAEQEIGNGWFRGVHPEDASLCEGVYNDAFEQRVPFHLEFRLRRTDGAFRWILGQGIPRVSGNGEFYGFIGSCIDITERKKNEEELEAHRFHLEELMAVRTSALQKSMERLRSSERLAAIGTLAAGIAHEINNPLNAILLTAECAVRLDREDKPSDQMREMLEIIKLEAMRGGRVVQNVLKFARQEQTVKVAVDIGTIIEDALRLMKTYTHSGALSIKVDVDKDLPVVFVNSTEIQQVLINLIKNASEAAGGKVHVLIKAVRAGDGINLTVADNGPGIADADVPRVFDPFYSTQQSTGGMGLGLSICHGIIDEHGGSISVTSETGKGTTFAISLPAMQHDSPI